MSQGYETQPYKLIKDFEVFEIRYYPSVHMVQTESTETSGNNFSKLFQYISGSNESNLKIAMTTPVHMEKKGGEEKMAFVIPSSIKTPPEPQNENVRLIQSKAAYFAALKYSGYTNKAKSDFYTEKLREHINNKGLKILGEAVVLGYNSPYKFFNRLNEIIIEIDY